MALMLHLDGLPISVPDEALDGLLAVLEAKARSKVVEQLPPGGRERLAVKAALLLFLPKMRAFARGIAPDYPPPDPPRHCDLIAYLTDYWLAFLLFALRELRAEVAQQRWEVSTVETPDGGLQVTGVAGSLALLAPDAGDARAAGGGEGPADDASPSGAAPAADRGGLPGEPGGSLVSAGHDRER